MHGARDGHARGQPFDRRDMKFAGTRAVPRGVSKRPVSTTGSENSIATGVGDLRVKG